MEIRQLECFIATCRFGSISRAASAMHISQPAVSTAIRNLEETLNVSLFDRSNRQIKLTSVGNEILQQAESIIRSRDNIEKICRQYNDVLVNRVTVVTSATPFIVPHLLNDYLAANPDIQLNILMEKGEASAAIDNHEADIIVYASHNELFDSTITTCFKEEIFLAVPENHPLYGRSMINLGELAQYPIVSLSGNRPMRMIEDYYCRLAGFSPKRCMECDSLEMFTNIVNNGHGVAFVPSQSWKELDVPPSRLIRIRKPECFRYVSVSRNATKHASKEAVQKTFDYIVGLLQSQNSKNNKSE